MAASNRAARERQTASYARFPEADRTVSCVFSEAAVRPRFDDSLVDRRGFEHLRCMRLRLCSDKNDCSKIVVSNVVVWPPPLGIALLTFQMCHHSFLCFERFLAFGTFHELWGASLFMSPSHVVK